MHCHLTMYVRLNASHPQQGRCRAFALAVVVSYVIITFGFCFTLCVVSTRLVIETQGKSYVLPGTNVTIPVDEWPYHLREDVLLTSVCTATYVVLACLSWCVIVQAPQRYLPVMISFLWLLLPFVACSVGVARYDALDEAARALWDTVSPTFRNLYYLECQVLGVVAVALGGSFASLHPKVKAYFEQD